jgi:hypothetical protein
VGHADLQRLAELHRRATSSPSGIHAAGAGTSRPGHAVPLGGQINIRSHGFSDHGSNRRFRFLKLACRFREHQP